MQKNNNEEVSLQEQEIKSNRGLIQYAAIGISVIVIAVFLVFALGKISECITNYANNYYKQYFLNREPGFSSPWYEKGLHKVDEAFVNTLSNKQDKVVYLLGSSVSSNSVDDASRNLDNGYVYKTLVCGNGCYRSNRILINLAEEASLFTDKDIIKYEVSFSTFRDSEKTITETVVDKWGKYTVNDDLSVTKNSSLLNPLYAVNIELIKIQNSWELLYSYWEQMNHPDRFPKPIGLGNFKNNYFNYDAVADSCHFTDEYKESVLKDIDELNEKYVEVVEISPFPNGLLQTDYGDMVNEFVTNELIPHLEEKGIRYRDLRNAFDDSEFADGVHLSYDAEVSYTKDLNEYMNSVIAEIK